MLEVLSWICIGGGALLGIIGGIGMHRFPDFYSRMHAAGTTDTLCAALFLLGLAFQAGLTLVTLKLIIIFTFLLFTSPTAAHALANAALHGGLKPELDDEPGDRT
jgi:multicomponent Na+:H+ antiporter subunit G